jgi:hypothetical protein
MEGSVVTHEATSAELLHESFAGTSSRISPSVYETARVVAIAPWLDGHRERVEYLLQQQATDGGWGISTARLVPSLSATEALLSLDKNTLDAKLWEAARTAIPVAIGFLRRETLRVSSMGELPDTVAIEFIVPELTIRINYFLEKENVEFLPLLAGSQVERLAEAHAVVSAGQPLPRKLWHSWETFGSTEAAELVCPDDGAVACSPAATALWASGQPTMPTETSRYFAEINARDGGPVPVAAPMPHFERSWLLTTFAMYGVPHPLREDCMDVLEGALGPSGAAAGDGLPPDCDDTAMVTSALAMSARRVDLKPLMSFFRDTHFECYPQERTSSPSTNAHALIALCAAAQWWETSSDAPVAAETTARWLVDQQRLDGSWNDKWHTSPFYSTWCCVEAIVAATGSQLTIRAGRDWDPEGAIAAAVDWALRADSPAGWGSVGANVEETCYAALILSRAARPEQVCAARPALRKALAVIEDVHPEESWPTLWIGKDLYTPQRVVQGVKLTARQVLRELLATTANAWSVYTEDELILPVACPYPVRTNPGAAQVLRTVVDRLTLRGAIDDRVLTIATSSSLDVALALSHPDAPPERLEVAALWYLFLIYADDHWDAASSTADSRWASRLYDEQEDLRNILRGGSPISGRMTAQLLYETLHKIAVVDSVFDDSLLRQAIRDYLVGVQWELHQRAVSQIPDLITYIRMRRVFSTAAVQLELAPFVSGHNLPQTARTNPVVQLLDATAADYGCLVNDYYSYLRESDVERSTSNVVTVLQVREGFDQPRAVRRTEELIQRSTRTFAETRKLLSTCVLDATPDELEGYAVCHENFMSAAARWPALAKRYEAPPANRPNPMNLRSADRTEDRSTHAP